MINIRLLNGVTGNEEKQLINTVHNICIIVIVIFSIIINIHKNIDKNPSLFKLKRSSGSFSFLFFLFFFLARLSFLKQLKQLAQSSPCLLKLIWLYRVFQHSASPVSSVKWTETEKPKRKPPKINKRKIKHFQQDRKKNSIHQSIHISKCHLCLIKSSPHMYNKCV